MTGPTHRIRTAVVARSESHGHARCERCGDRPPEQIHHRKPRAMGGTSDPAVNSPANLVAICAYCHLAIELGRTDAFLDGWLVRNSEDPAEIPVRYRGRFVQLTGNGDVITPTGGGSHDIEG